MKRLAVLFLSVVLLVGCLGLSSCKEDTYDPKKDPDYGWTPNY